MRPRALGKLPAIDIVILTHDHYDHLDYQTIRDLRGTTKAFYAPLGVGEHLAYWGAIKGGLPNWTGRSRLSCRRG